MEYSKISQPCCVIFQQPPSTKQDSDKKHCNNNDNKIVIIMMKLLSVQNIYVHQDWNLRTTNQMATFRRINQNVQGRKKRLVFSFSWVFHVLRGGTYWALLSTPGGNMLRHIYLNVNYVYKKLSNSVQIYSPLNLCLLKSSFSNVFLCGGL